MTITQADTFVPVRKSARALSPKIALRRARKLAKMMRRNDRRFRDRVRMSAMEG